MGWRGWQAYDSNRDDFNRPLIFSLAAFDHEQGTLLFGGVFKVLGRREDQSDFEVAEILPEPYIERLFPGYEESNLTCKKLETLVRNNRTDCKAALESVKGVDLITDTLTGKRWSTLLTVTLESGPDGQLTPKQVMVET